MRAYYGYRILEFRDGKKRVHFPRRPVVNDYEIARCRIFDLMRLFRGQTREFQIWDGINPVSKLRFEKGRFISESPVFTEYSQKEADAIWADSQKARLKNQRVGMKPGDLSHWIKKESEKEVLLRRLNKDGYVQKERLTKRSLDGSYTK